METLDARIARLIAFREFLPSSAADMLSEAVLIAEAIIAEFPEILPIDVSGETDTLHK